LTIPALAPHYEIEVTRPDRLDMFSILVEARPGAAPEEARAGAKELADRVKTLIGVSAKVTVVDPGSLARSQGKAQRVRDLRQD
ncbi:MAG: phenylacetate--CoA ligase, partial [Pseudomonadota bacterium]